MLHSLINHVLKRQEEIYKKLVSSFCKKNVVTIVALRLQHVGWGADVQYLSSIIASFGCKQITAVSATALEENLHIKIHLFFKLQEL